MTHWTQAVPMAECKRPCFARQVIDHQRLAADSLRCGTKSMEKGRVQPCFARHFDQPALAQPLTYDEVVALADSTPSSASNTQPGTSSTWFSAIFDTKSVRCYAYDNERFC